MASTQCANLSKYEPFQDRVDYFLKKAAIAVMAEDAATANHASRVLFASLCLRDYISIKSIALGITTNATLTATIGSNNEETANAAIVDGDLEYTVNSMFTSFSIKE